MLNKIYEKIKKFILENYKFMIILIVLVFTFTYEFPYVVYTPGGIVNLEKRIDVTKLSSFHARVFGRISELLLDVWIETNGESYVEAPLVNIEKTNWVKKGSAFLKAKFEKKKYEGSF